MTTRVLLIRHAQSEWNADGRWQGWADPPLSEAGKAAAEEATTDPVLDDVEAIASSDLTRARSTATILATGRRWEPVLSLRGLRERSAGDWTGLTRAEIDSKWPGALARIPAPIPGGEAPAAVTARALVALHRIAGAHPGQTVLAVSHGALIRGVFEHLGMTLASVPNLGGRWLDISAGQIRTGAPYELSGATTTEQAG